MFVNCKWCDKKLKTYPCRIQNNKGKFCNRSCTMNWRTKYGDLNMRGEKHHLWKGENVSIEAGRIRARNLFKPKPCEECGNKAEIHHIDGNPVNNKSSNIKWVCRNHHMLIDGRLDRDKKGRFYAKRKNIKS